jgi:sugar phosphate isomerase/epimerase
LYAGGELEVSAGFSAQAIKAALEKNYAVGYRAVEYSHICHLSPAEAKAVGEYAAALGMQSWSIHAEAAGGFVLGRSAQEAREALFHCLEVCHAVGARVIVVHAPLLIGLRLDDTPDISKTLALDLEVLGQAAAKAAELDVALALENGRSLAHWVYVQSLVDRLESDQVGLCVDTGHANLGDLDAARAIRMAGERLLTTHLHDNWGERDDHLPPGRGTIDWQDVFDALKQVGYRRPLMLELTDRAAHRSYDQDLELRQGYDNVAGYVQGGE